MLTTCVRALPSAVRSSMGASSPAWPTAGGRRRGQTPPPPAPDEEPQRAPRRCRANGRSHPPVAPGPDRYAAPPGGQAAPREGRGPRPRPAAAFHQGLPTAVGRWKLPRAIRSRRARLRAALPLPAAPYLSRPRRRRPSHAAAAPHTPLLSSLLPLCSFCRQARLSAGNQPTAAKTAVVTFPSLLVLGAQRASPGGERWLLNLPQRRGFPRRVGRGGAGPGRATPRPGVKGAAGVPVPSWRVPGAALRG